MRHGMDWRWDLPKSARMLLAVGQLWQHLLCCRCNRYTYDCIDDCIADYSITDSITDYRITDSITDYSITDSITDYRITDYSIADYGWNLR
jgi:hypothetical protein